MTHDTMMALAEIHARLARIDKLLKISNSKFDREIMRHLHDNQKSLTTLLSGVILDAIQGDQSYSKADDGSASDEAEEAAESPSAVLAGKE